MSQAGEKSEQGYVPESALRALVDETTWILRNAPLPDGKFARLKRAVDEARGVLEATGDGNG